MKKTNKFSIKMFFIFSLILFFSMIFIILLNRVFLNKYYIYKYKIKMEKELKEISKNQNDIYYIIKNYKGEFNVFISKKKNFRDNNFHMSMGMMTNTTMMKNHIINNLIKKLDENKDYIIDSYYNMPFGYNEIVGVLKKNDDFIVMTFPINKIKENSQIANELFLIIVFIVIFSVSFVNFYFIKRFSKPLKKLIDFTNGLANLDFSKRIQLKTGDEIENLANSFNYLANELEINFKKLNDVTENLKKEKDIRDEFLKNVNHELKTPIALIKAYTEGLKDNIADDREEYYNIILNETDRMEEMVKKLLEVIKNEEINLKKLEKINLKNYIENILEKFKVDFINNNIKKDIEINESINICYTKTDFETLMVNIITNAIGNIKEPKQFYIKGKDNNEYIELAIFNSSEKIDDEEIEKLWEPFYKKDKSRKRSYGGTGLGLSIIKKILNKHKNNFLFAYNENKKGMEFKILFKKESCK
ncbi:signal transduction histidine kinase [Hypnocyclicus thermotrophus]|uniref:histidine kinase n=1 Tax=Hypnocyclicus thermotrophus TaxID=1627895 RepID=A0AA46DXQ4_9FUSO|nr:HAMP domain-containing sensor histidine kinase [Hypnocyclicus thermotrophus]TDT68624.1 signal transduction histidine kinase [Hypnocyclicus thermotrophus]